MATILEGSNVSPMELRKAPDDFPDELNIWLDEVEDNEYFPTVELAVEDIPVQYVGVYKLVEIKKREKFKFYEP